MDSSLRAISTHYGPALRLCVSKHIIIDSRNGFHLFDSKPLLLEPELTHCQFDPYKKNFRKIEMKNTCIFTSKNAFDSVIRLFEFPVNNLVSCLWKHRDRQWAIVPHLTLGAPRLLLIFPQAVSIWIISVKVFLIILKYRNVSTISTFIGQISHYHTIFCCWMIVK